MVLTARQPQPEPSELEQAVRQVSKLSARKQKQIVEFIGMVSGKRAK
jgi:toxic protein SymE